VHSSYKFITFIDVSGQPKYSKTVFSGICGNYPDYAIILVDATKGVTTACKDYFKMISKMQVPFIVVVTKIDAA